MFEETFKKLGETFEAFKVEVEKTFKDPKGLRAPSVLVRNGDVYIEGHFRKLFVNGREVRFK